jgi:hypothetical protein
MIAYIPYEFNPDRPNGIPLKWPWRSITVHSASEAPEGYIVITEEEFNNIIENLKPEYQAWEQQNNLIENTNKYIDSLIDKTINECQKIKKEFIRENILLGISHLSFKGIPLTDHVLNITSKIMMAFETGSTKSAIRRIIELNPDDFDGVILNEERILKLRNKIESFHGWPLSTSYNQPPTWTD